MEKGRRLNRKAGDNYQDMTAKWIWGKRVKRGLHAAFLRVIIPKVKFDSQLKSI